MNAEQARALAAKAQESIEAKAHVTALDMLPDILSRIETYATEGQTRCEFPLGKQPVEDRTVGEKIIVLLSEHGYNAAIVPLMDGAESVMGYNPTAGDIHKREKLVVSW